MVHGTLTSILAVCMLYTSPIEFIVRQFFWLLLAVLVIGSVNGLFFYPILLSLIGPDAEIMPLEHPDRISTPSPIPQYRPKKFNNMNNCKSIYVNNKKQYHRGSMCTSPSCSKPYHHHSSAGYNNNLSQQQLHQQQQQQQYHKSQNNLVNNQNEPSLTTITEEPQSWQSSASSVASFDHMNFHHHQQQVPQPQPPQMQQQQQPMYHQRHPQYSYHKSNLSSSSSSRENKNLNCPPPPQQQQQQQHQQHQHSQHQSQNMAPELQSIVLQPEVTVETNGGNGPNTKVTANIKVELVTPGRAIRTYNMN